MIAFSFTLAVASPRMAGIDRAGGRIKLQARAYLSEPSAAQTIYVFIQGRDVETPYVRLFAQIQKDYEIELRTGASTISTFRYQ